MTALVGGSKLMAQGVPYVPFHCGHFFYGHLALTVQAGSLTIFPSLELDDSGACVSNLEARNKTAGYSDIGLVNCRAQSHPHMLAAVGPRGLAWSSPSELR